MNKYLYKLSTFFLLLLLSHIALPHFAYSQSIGPNYLTIINQLRGRKCCSEGSVESTLQQLKNAIDLQMPTTFVARYDAINDKEFQEILRNYSQKYPDFIKLGVMIEITPDLAQDAGVMYKGTDENWFQAQNVFTIGYSPSDREKLADQIMKSFHTAFGYFPTVTSAWMIDTETANTLHEKYGVKTHQITREQWGTDSYTLYGGPPHYPYPASHNWIFMPNSSPEDALMIVRQTITDPLYNYGDTTSAFTSQPNDYSRDGKSIEYFKEVFSNAMRQPKGQSGFALLGLENSMSKYFQEEFTKQLDFINQNAENLDLKIVFADDSEMLKYYKESKINIYTRSSGSNEASFITTPNYRVRLITTGGKTSVSDIRVYSDKIKDPYTESVAKYEGFWIAPFLLDGSRWYKPKESRSEPHYFLPTKNDFRISASLLDFGDDNNKISDILVQPKSITFLNESGQKSIVFEENKLWTPEDIKSVSFTPSQFPVQIDDEADILEITWKNTEDFPTFGLKRNKCTSDMCEYNLSLSDPSAIDNLYMSQYPYLFPEPVNRQLSQTYSHVSIHNRFAIVDRNPVRIILEPHDKFNFPIILNEEAKITADTMQDLRIEKIGTLKKSQYQYVDFYSSLAGRHKVDITMTQRESDFQSQITIFFAPNCKTSISHCVTHPIESIWYIITKISDWWNKRV